MACKGYCRTRKGAPCLKGLAIERQHQHAARQDREAVSLVTRGVESEGAEAPFEDARAEEGLSEQGGQRASSAVVESLAYGSNNKRFHPSFGLLKLEAT